MAESLTRGSRVIVTGRLKQRSFETKEGEKRTVIELEVDEIGPSLRYATAKVNRAQRVRQRRRSAATAPAVRRLGGRPAVQRPGRRPVEIGAARRSAGGYTDEPPF